MRIMHIHGIYAEAHQHLVLEDGTVFPGIAGRRRRASPPGEACFTTAMTGYEEAVTDPSYVAQVLCFAYPLIGTYGVDESRMESERVQCEGVVMRDVRPEFAAWLREQGVVALTGVDTRTLVRQDPRRRRAALRARRRAGRGAARRARSPSRSSTAARSTAQVGRDRSRTRSAPARASSSSTSARSARSRAGSPTPGSRRTSCRARGTPTRSSRPSPRVVLIANGPGDPAVFTDQIETIRSLLGRVPLFGVCLGHQLLGLALGHETFKLPLRPPRREPSGARRRRPAACSSPSRTTASRCSPNGDISHVSLNDGTCEGLAGDGFESVQFHPEASPGPARRAALLRPPGRGMPKRTDLRSILILGSGPIRIGQACEFDYSGAQACRVLRREGYRVVLVNSNPATIMTDPEWADATYLEPLDAETVAEVIEREQPDAILPTLGGQTALNLAVELARSRRAGSS